MPRLTLVMVILAACGCGGHTTTGGGGGGGSSVPCTVASDCGAATECLGWACTGATCLAQPVAAGTEVLVQQAGDCQVTVCDGNGSVTNEPDDADLPGDDGDPCTQAACSSGMPSQTLLPAGTVCGYYACCDGAGSCYGMCVSDDVCYPPPTPCSSSYCSECGTCEIASDPAGTPLPPGDQQSGDCQLLTCDGAGGAVSVPDDTDVPDDDGDPCTVEQCAGGVPTTSPLCPGQSCNQGVCS